VDQLIEYVRTLLDCAYETGLKANGGARVVLLNQQLRWEDAIADAQRPAERVIARLIAQAFGEAAELLRTTPRPVLGQPLEDEVQGAKEDV
jgi:hypothetical protein